MSKHLAIANLTTRLLEHAAMVEPIIHGRDLPGSGRHRDNYLEVPEADEYAA
jgi:hypothetical protein